MAALFAERPRVPEAKRQRGERPAAAEARRGEAPAPAAEARRPAAEDENLLVGSPQDAIVKEEIQTDEEAEAEPPVARLVDILIMRRAARLREEAAKGKGKAAAPAEERRPLWLPDYGKSKGKYSGYKGGDSWHKGYKGS